MSFDIKDKKRRDTRKFSLTKCFRFQPKKKNNPRQQEISNPLSQSISRHRNNLFRIIKKKEAYFTIRTGLKVIVFQRLHCRHYHGFRLIRRDQSGRKISSKSKKKKKRNGIDQRWNVFVRESYVISHRSE